MTRYKKIKEIIQQKYSDFTTNDRIIAEFCIDNFDRIPFLNVQEISKSTNSSVASIIRFSQKIGFNGYSALQKEISKNLQKHLSNKITFPLLQNGEMEKNILTMVANQDISNINDTLSMIEGESFDSMISYIINSKRIFTMGLGISNLLAQILAYQLNQVGIKAYCFNHSHSSFTEQVLFMDSDDLLIGFSFPPYSKETINTAKFAKGQNLKVIAISDRLSSPISFHSDLVLPVKSENKLYTNSFAAISVIINAIATKCASMDKNRAKNMLKEFKNLSKINKDLIE